VQNGSEGQHRASDRREGHHIALVFYLFLANLGVGIVFTLVLVSREAGVKFFRFNAGLAAALMAVALMFRPTGGGPDFVDPHLAGVAFIALLVAEAATIVYWLTVGRMLASIRPAVIATAIGAGVVMLVA